MAFSAPTQLQNNKGGNGSFRPMKRKSSRPGAVAEMDIMDQQDLRMRFRNSRDPLYIAFDHIDSRPVSELAVNFVKESIFEFVNMISFNK